MYTATVLNSVKEALRDSKELLHYMTSDSIILNDSSDSAPPTIGEKFCIVHSVDRFNPNIKSESYMDKILFGVTVGQRFRSVPMDRVGKYLYETVDDSIELLNNIVILYIYNNIYNIHNRIVSNWNTNKASLPIDVAELFSSIDFIDRIRYMYSETVPVKRYPDYFSSNENPPNHSNPRPAAITLTTTFQAPHIARPNSC